MTGFTANLGISYDRKFLNCYYYKEFINLEFSDIYNHHGFNSKLLIAFT